MEFFELAIAAIFVNNILLAQFLGNCPFIGVSKQLSTAAGMAMAVIFVLTLAAVVAFMVEHYILVPFELEYLRTLAFILVIASLVQLTEMFLRKSVPALYRSLGIFLPLITTNCAVLGVAINNITMGHNILECLVYSIASAIGFGLALILFAGLRERFETAEIPKPLRGTGIGLVTAGYLSLCFIAFKGML